MDLTFVWPFDGAAFVWRSDPSLGLLTVIVKATFALGQAGETRLVQPRAPEIGDRLSSPGGSLLDASDYAPWKPRGDVFVVGHVRGLGAGRVRVGFSAGGVQKSLLAYGDRTLRGGAASRPAALGRIPIAYERAPLSPANPVGIDVARLEEGGALPNFEEDPAARARVVGLSPVSPRWPQRALEGEAERAFAEAILAGAGTRAGSASASLDFAHFNVAPVDQQTTRLDLGAPIELFALHPGERELRTRLPEVRPLVRCEATGAAGPIEPTPDTLRIDADAGTATVTWRATLRLPSADPREVGRVLVQPAAPVSRSVPPRRAPIESSPPSEGDEEREDDEEEQLTSPAILVDRQKLESARAPAPLPASASALPFLQPEASPAPRPGEAAGARAALPFLQPRANAMPDAPDDAFETKTAPVSRDLLAAALPFMAQRAPEAIPAALPLPAPPPSVAGLPFAPFPPAPPSTPSPSPSPEVLPFRPSAPGPSFPAPPPSRPGRRDTLPPLAFPSPVSPLPAPAALPWPGTPPPPLAAKGPAAPETLPPPPNLAPPPEPRGEQAPVASTLDGRDVPPEEIAPEKMSIEEIAAEEMSIEVYGAACAGLADGRRPRAEVLARAGLDERRWPRTVEAMDALVAERAEHGARFDEAYVEAHAVLSGIDLRGYARLSVALEREGPLAAVAPLGIPLADLIRLQRVWTRRVAADHTLAEQLRVRMQEAREG